MNNKLTFLFDSECPLCRREINFLKQRDLHKNILFVDINKDNFNSINFKNITYLEAMENLHGILEDGEIIKGLDVLAYSYDLIGLGWLYYPLKIPFLSNFLRVIYKYWAGNRLAITGRSSLKTLCSQKCIEIK
ncbi:MAG: thiol-disulfide oxidoreductase [Prochlorococcus sp. SP3034]|nr:thiol-disulfide oxidoreductase [Prochlorococcus sp. SP3034]|tara:strand:+ start:3502 stop:3900 length:399 start_codon:yes stop_codon:yes gene_type:complete